MTAAYLQLANAVHTVDIERAVFFSGPTLDNNGGGGFRKMMEMKGPGVFSFHCYAPPQPGPLGYSVYFAFQTF